MATVMEIRNEAAKLSLDERAELAAYLLETLEIEHHWVEDAEVQRRLGELKSGKVKGLS